jgi:hypothetical protein
VNGEKREWEKVVKRETKIRSFETSIHDSRNTETRTNDLRTDNSLAPKHRFTNIEQTIHEQTIHELRNTNSRTSNKRFTNRQFTSFETPIYEY